MQWTAENANRLYGLYERYVDRLRADVIRANRSPGSSRPERIGLEPLPRAEFDALLDHPAADPEAVRLWVRRIIRGHEREFPFLRVDSAHD